MVKKHSDPGTPGCEDEDNIKLTNDDHDYDDDDYDNDELIMIHIDQVRAWIPKAEQI